MKENNNRNDVNRQANKNIKTIAVIVVVAITITLVISCIYEINYNDWSSNGWWQ